MEAGKSETFSSLARATSAFHKAASKVVSEADAAVLLGKVTGPNSSTTLAAKSTDDLAVVFYGAYYDRAAD